jgi:hypothetical protein
MAGCIEGMAGCVAGCVVAPDVRTIIGTRSRDECPTQPKGQPKDDKTGHYAERLERPGGCLPNCDVRIPLRARRDGARVRAVPAILPDVSLGHRLISFYLAI